MYCHDLEVMSSNPGQVKLRVRITSVQVALEPKILLENPEFFEAGCYWKSRKNLRQGVIGNPGRI